MQIRGAYMRTRGVRMWLNVGGRSGGGTHGGVADGGVADGGDRMVVMQMVVIGWW